MDVEERDTYPVEPAVFIPITASALLSSGPPESPATTFALTPTSPVSRVAPPVSSPTMIDCRSAVTEPVTVLSVPVPPALPTAVIRSPTATLEDSPVVTVSRFEAPARRSTATSSATS